MSDVDRLDWLTQNWSRVRPDMDITPWQVWGRTTRIHDLFLAAITPALKKHGLTFKEFQTLAALVLVGPPYQANPNEITKFNLLTSGGTTNLLSRMEKEGLVRRKPDPADKRGVIVQITDKGLDSFSASVVEENRIEHDLLSTLSPEERRVLAILLRKLLLSIDPVPATRNTDRQAGGGPS